MGTLLNKGAAENGPTKSKWWSRFELPPIKECSSSTLIIQWHLMPWDDDAYEEVHDELLDRCAFFDLADKFRREFKAAVEQQLDQPKTGEVR
jgi:hypothetical protein